MLGRRHILAAVVVVVAFPLPFPFSFSLFSLFSPAVFSFSFPFPFSVVPRDFLRLVAILVGLASAGVRLVETGLIARAPPSMVVTGKTATAARAHATATATVFVPSSPAFALGLLR